jgi:tetratricopeptide (TPR) repeat protein
MMPRSLASLLLVVLLMATCPAWLWAAAAPPMSTSPTMAMPMLETADPVLLKAEISLIRGDAAVATSIYEAMLRKNPTAWEPMVGLASIATRRGQYEAAERFLLKASATHPNQPQVWAELAHLYNHWALTKWQKNKVPAQAFKANQAMERAQQLAPSNPLVLTYLGEIALDRGERVLAERALQQVLDAQPSYVPAMRQAARLYMLQRDYNRARNVLLRSLELAPQDSAAYFLMAQLLQQVDRPQEALQMAQTSESYDFGDLPERDLLMAQEYKRLGDTDKAIAYYQRLAEYSPGNPQITLKIAQLQEHRGDQALATKVYQQATAQDPGILVQLVQQAQAATRTQPNEAALAQWRKVLAISPGYPPAVHGVASIYWVQSRQGAINNETFAFDRKYGDQLQAAYLKQHPDEIPLLAVDQVKLAMAGEGRLTPNEAQKAQLVPITQQPNNNLAAGEAAFLMGNYPLAQELLEGFDGQTAEGYIQAADRLLLDRELTTSKQWYIRANQLKPGPEAQAGLAQVARQQHMATDYLQDGDALLNQGKAQEAMVQYRAALAVDPQLVSAYLKLSDAQYKLRLKAEALASVEQAVALQPGLLSSETFAKRYKKWGGRRSLPASQKPK